MPLTILVVEDHTDFRRLTCAALQRRAEFHIIEAADGLEAVQKAEQLRPDLVLLDINLPKMNGFEVAKRIRSFAPDARLLFMSQESSPDIVRKALSLGALGYVHKISAGTDLLPAIDAVLAGQRFVSESVVLSVPVNASGPRRHEVLFCKDDAAMIDGFARFLAGALIAGDAAIFRVPESHRMRLVRELRTRGVDIDGAIQRGICLSLEADSTVDLAQVLEAIEGVRAAAARAGKAHARVAFCGELAGRLWAAGRTAEAIQLEQLAHLAPPHVDILCAYPVPYTNDDPALAHICALHTAVSAG